MAIKAAFTIGSPARYFHHGPERERSLERPEIRLQSELVVGFGVPKAASQEERRSEPGPERTTYALLTNDGGTPAVVRQQLIGRSLRAAAVSELLAGGAQMRARDGLRAHQGAWGLRSVRAAAPGAA